MYFSLDEHSCLLRKGEKADSVDLRYDRDAENTEDTGNISGIQRI